MNPPERSTLLKGKTVSLPTGVRKITHCQVRIVTGDIVIEYPTRKLTIDGYNALKAAGVKVELGPSDEGTES